MVDQQEYEQISMDLLPTLYKIGYSMLRSTPDTQDAIQQALMKAWEKKHTVKAGGYRAFLTRIVINECYNIQRHRMRVIPAELSYLPAGASPDYRELYETIDKLPEDLRLPLILKYLYDQSEKEAARALGGPVTTFKNRLHRARKTMRKLLDREVVFE
jgi:RNA polymerase sigma-70 factor (ECF subfamily)